MPDRGRFTADGTQQTSAEGAGAGTPYATLLAKGTWGGGTLKVEAGFYGQADALLWVDVTDSFLTADGCVTFAINAHALRVTLSGSTAPSLDWALV